MYRTLLEMAEKEHLDIATCNGTYVYEKRRESHPIFPLDRLPSTGVLPGHVELGPDVRLPRFVSQSLPRLPVMRFQQQGPKRVRCRLDLVRDGARLKPQML